MDACARERVSMSFPIPFSCLLVAWATACNPDRMAAPRPTGVPLPPSSSSSPVRPKEALLQPAPPEGKKPVIPPEKLPDFDPKWVQALGADGVQKLEIAASVCAAALKHDAGKLRVGCRACPPFDSTSGPDGQIVVDPQQDFYEVEAVYLGSFTRTGAREAAAVMLGCEPHAGNFGGTLLVEWS